MNIVNLTVHKNTLEQHRARKRRKGLERAAKRQGRATVMLDGYCLVTWDRDGNADVDWISGDMPTSNLPEYVKATIQRSIAKRDTE